MSIENTTQEATVVTVDRSQQRKRVTPFMKRFIQKMEFHYPGLDVSYDENFVFIDEKAREFFNVFGLGRVDQHKTDPGCFILAKLTENGLVLAKNPKVMKTKSEATVARKFMGRKHGLNFFELTTPVHIMDTMEKVWRTAHGKEGPIPVSLSEPSKK